MPGPRIGDRRVSALTVALADGVSTARVSLGNRTWEESLQGYEKNTGIRAKLTGTDGVRQTDGLVGVW